MPDYEPAQITAEFSLPFPRLVKLPTLPPMIAEFGVVFVRPSRLYSSCAIVAEFSLHGIGSGAGGGGVEPSAFGEGDRKPYYSQSREGLLYMTDGWGRMRRWDGLTDSWELAGVSAPDRPLSFRPTGSVGFKSGSWSARYRFLDRFYNPSNPSPESVTITVPDISGVAQAVEAFGSGLLITSAGHGLEVGGRKDLSINLGERVAIRWPGGIEESADYSVIDEDRFTVNLPEATHRVAGAEWAHNISCFSYDINSGAMLQFFSGRMQGTASGNVITTQEPHGISGYGEDGLADGIVSLYDSSTLAGTCTNFPWVSSITRFQFVVVDEKRLALFRPVGTGSSMGRELGPPADWVEHAARTCFEVPQEGSGSGAGMAPPPGSPVPGQRGGEPLHFPHDTPWEAQLFEPAVGVPDEAEIIQILRTRSGSAAAVYVDVEIDVSSRESSATSCSDDGELGESVTLIDPFTGDASYALRFGLPPFDKPYVVESGGRMVAAGDPTWTEGAVQVVKGSRLVRGVATSWAGNFRDRLLTVEGADKGYHIESRSGQRLTLTKPYEGESSEYARYSIGPSYRLRRVLQWSEAGYPEAWYALSTVSLPADSEGGRVTGLASFDNSAICFTESRSFRFSFNIDPATDGGVIPIMDRGCVNNDCWVRAEGYLYALDRRGVYRTRGMGDEDVSTAIQNIFAGWDSELSINWKWSDYFHATLDPRNDSILFAVSLTGGEPRHILAYRIKTEAWDVIEYPVPITGSVVARVSGRQRVIYSSDRGSVLVSDEGDQDGSISGSGSITSAGYDWVEDSSTTFSGVSDSAVYIVSGDGKGQWRRVVSASGSRLYLASPWKITPRPSDMYIVGGVQWNWRTGWHSWSDSDRMEPRHVSVLYRPSRPSSVMDMRLYVDQSDDPKVMGVTRTAYGMSSRRGSPDISVGVDKTNGYSQFQCDDQRETRADGERRVSVELSGVTDREDHSIYELAIDGASE